MDIASSYRLEINTRTSELFQPVAIQLENHSVSNRFIGILFSKSMANRSFVHSPALKGIPARGDLTDVDMPKGCLCFQTIGE